MREIDPKNIIAGSRLRGKSSDTTSLHSRRKSAVVESDEDEDESDDNADEDEQGDESEEDSE
jgi:hypothetical protein